MNVFLMLVTRGENLVILKIYVNNKMIITYIMEER